MNILNCTIYFLFFAFSTQAQTKETTYYKDKYCSKKTSAAKAKFSKTTINNVDGSIEIIKQKANADEILEHYKADEQIGVWKEGNTVRNFDFKISYTTTGCPDTLEGINCTELFSDNITLKYKAPRIASGEKDLYTFLSNEVVFPDKAINEGISGESQIFFEVNEYGGIQNIQATNGRKIFFDKEVVRLIRKLQLSSPAMLDHKPIKICVKLPFKFVIQ